MTHRSRTLHFYTARPMSNYNQDIPAKLSNNGMASMPDALSTRPIAISRVKVGIACPRCHSGDIHTSFKKWIRACSSLLPFSFIVLLVQVAAARFSDPNPLCEFFTTLAVMSGITSVWFFLGAIFGGNHCYECKHIWFGE